MIKMLISLLERSGADAWQVTDTKTEGREYYFIRHALDQNRIRRVEHIRVQVFKKSPDGTSIGSAGAEIPPTADENAAQLLIRRLLSEAALLKNPIYSLQMPTSVPDEKDAPVDPDAAAADFIRVMRSLDEDADAFVNSYEIFSSAVTRRVINSNGIDVTCVYPQSMLETVVNARREGHEIELYRMITSGTCSREGVRSVLNTALKSGRDRLKAVPTSSLGKAALVLPARTASPVWQYYISRMNASMKYQGISDWEKGQTVIPSECGKTAVIRAVRKLENSSSNAGWDPEGALVRDLTIIENGRAAAWWGERQFCSYLGISDSFIPGNFAVSGGTDDEKALLSGSYLEAVDFSDFQVDPVTGSIAGELRLGYLHENDCVIPVTGGSVSGSMKDLASGLAFTSGSTLCDDLLLPRFTRIDGVSITGAV